MKKITLWLVGCLSVLSVVLFWCLPPIVDKSMNKVSPHNPWPVSAAANKLHQSLIIGDWHADSLLWNRNFLSHNRFGHVDLPRLQQGNVAFQVITAVTKSPKGQNYDNNSAEAADRITDLVMAQAWPIRTWSSLYQRALYQVERLQTLEKKSPDQLRIIRSRADMAAVINSRATERPLTGLLMGMEGAHPLEGQLSKLDSLYDAGYRLIGLQHFFDNDLGGSLHGQSNAGLTAFGRQVVQHAEAKHMIIDVAHSSVAVVEDVLALVTRPIVLSHTGIHGHCQAKRNIADAVMQKIANKGGVVGIGYWADVVCDSSPRGIVEAIQAASDLLGIEHVSLGSDYDGTVEIQFDTSELAAITHELLLQGFSHSDIKKVMGENMIRVMKASLI